MNLNISASVAKTCTAKVSVCLLLCIISLVNAGCANQQQQTQEDDNVKARARAHTDLGAAYFQQRQFEIALDEFTQATKIDPSFASAYNGLGLVNAALGKDADADANYKRSVQLDPANSEARNNYGGFLCARNRIDESIVEFLAAVKNPLYATPAMAYTNAAICSMRKNDTAHAQVYLQQALQIDPLSQMAAYQLASIQFKNKDAAAAKKTLQNAVLARPGPEVLWLAVQIERAVGAKDAEASYALQLKNQYPDSDQAALLLNGK